MLKKVLQGPVEHDVKVTFLGKGWGIRIMLNGEINQESFVKHKDEIGKEIQSMLRMEDKCGNISNMAHRSRMRPHEKANNEKNEKN
jgi:hypothetical protein